MKMQRRANKQIEAGAAKGQAISRMFRKFTVQCIEEAEFIMLSLEQLEELEIQFPEVYEDIFKN